MKNEMCNADGQYQNADRNAANHRRRYVAAPEPPNIDELIYLAMLEWEAEEEYRAGCEAPDCE